MSIYSFMIVSVSEVNMTELKRMIYIRKYVCPYCGYTSDNLFPIEHYEGGSSGYRTFTCPDCGRGMEE